MVYRLALACVPFVAGGCPLHGAQTPTQQPDQPNPSHAPTPKVSGLRLPQHATGLLGDRGFPHREGPGPEADLGLHSPRQPRGGWFTSPGHHRAPLDPTPRSWLHMPR